MHPRDPSQSFHTSFLVLTFASLRDKPSTLRQQLGERGCGMTTATRAFLCVRSLGVLALLAALLAVLASGPDAVESAFPGANGKIAFYSIRDGNGEIYVMNPDGSAQTRLTNTTAGEQYPAWSADGTKIAFDSGRDGNQEIYVMDADGTGQTRLTNNAVLDTDPAWSPDGEKIAFYRSPGPSLFDIWVMNADGTGETQLTSDPAVESDPAWSPDGSKIAFHRFPPRDIYAMNADGTGQTNLTNNGLFNRFPNWSPDGTKITFMAGPAGTSDIYVMNANGTGQTALTSNGVNGTPAWSPDGTKIVFGTNSGEIKVMNANGSGQITLTSPPASGASPDWQPDADSDGVLPPEDVCPLLAGPASNSGCPPPGPPAVGGVVGLRDGSADPASRGSGSPTADDASLVAAALAGLAAIVAGAWYARCARLGRRLP